MIVVIAKLVSARGRGRDKILGGITIANDGTGTNASRNYSYAISKVNAKGVLCKGRVVGYKHHRDLFWDLLKMILEDARGKKR